MSLERLTNEGWYFRLFGAEFGPLPFQAVVRMVQTEQLGPDDVLRSGRAGLWRAVRDIVEFRPYLTISESPQGLRATKSQPSALEQESQWYYQLDGKTHGPMTLQTLLELVGTSGETASDVLVRAEDDDQWKPYQSIPGVPRASAVCVRTNLTCSDLAHDQGAARSAVKARPIAHRALPFDKRTLAIVAATWALINGVALLTLSDSYAAERSYYETLRELEAETRALQKGDADPQEWVALRARAKETLAPIVKDLKKKASAREPVCQHLLWAARDQFPKMIGPSNAETKAPMALYERHMRIVNEELSKQ